MSSTPPLNDEATPGTNTENAETTENQDNDPTSSKSVEDNQDYLDDDEILPFSKNEDPMPIPSSELLILFEREEDFELPGTPSSNPIDCPNNETIYQMTILPRTPAPESSTCMLNDNENECYLSSLTSLVGGGEGTIRPLSDILVWTETAMGTATGYLNTSRTSMTDILFGTGTALRSMTSLLSGARTVLTLGLLNRTSTVLRTMSDFIGSIERRTIESIRFVFRFMTYHISPNRNNDDYDNN
ncbi:testis-expressed protein 44 [Macrotis lagotis]|uniref:testis-expressed protein 44 n=1 Tax=Macrotis lagotis TaxID=92651 RepID=UPI003D697305